MRVHNFNYKNVNFGDSQALTNNFAIQNVRYGLNLLTQVYEKTTWHGAYSTNTLAWGRLLSITGIVFWATRADRWNAEQTLQNIIKPEYYLDTPTRGFYEYSFENDNWDKVKWMWKVYSDIRYEDTLDSPLIQFSFDILSEDPTLKWYNQKNTSGFDWFIGGNTLPFTLPVQFNCLIGTINVVNAWNWIAPVYIQVQGSLDNPVIRNLTNSRRYWVLKTTTDLIFDNTWDNVVVTDAWVNVKGLRKPWSKLLYLDPWNNTLILLSDTNYVPSQVTFSILRNDSYIN